MLITFNLPGMSNLYRGYPSDSCLLDGPFFVSNEQRLKATKLKPSVFYLIKKAMERGWSCWPEQ